MQTRMGLGLGLGMTRGGGGANAIDLVMVGDSIINSYPDPGFFSAATQDYIADRQGLTVNLTRIGAGGASWDYDFSASGTIETLINADIDAFTPNSLVVLFAGTNGLVLGGNTPAQEFADFETCLGIILGQGVVASNIVVCTMLPRQAYSEANRLTYNNLLIAGATTYGYKVAKFHLNWDIGWGGAQANTHWYPDQIHPTVNACDQMARIVYDQFYSDFYDAFQPSQLPGYWDHWDAQDTASITDAGSGRVSAWASATGTRSLDQGTSGNRPLYNATGLNGEPAIVFDGATRREFLTETGISFTCKPMASWCVVELDVDSDVRFIWGMYVTDTWENGLRLGTEASGLIRQVDAVNGGSNFYSSAFTAGEELIINSHIRTTSNAAPAYAVTKNGKNSSVGSLTNNNQITATVLRVGSPPLDNWRLRGKIGEIGFCNADITAYWHQLLTKKLGAKWGISTPDVP